MLAFAAILVLALAPAARTQTTVETLAMDIDGLELLKNDEFYELGRILNNIDAIGTSVKNFKQNTVPTTELLMQQGRDAMANLKEKLKTLSHTTTRVVSDVEGTVTLNKQNNIDVPLLEAEFSDLYDNKENLQNDKINDLGDDDEDIDSSIFRGISSAVRSLNAELNSIGLQNLALERYQQSRFCEHGMKLVKVGENATIIFDAQEFFVDVPDITCAITGFRAHIRDVFEATTSDPASYTDVLGVEVETLDTTQTGTIIAVTSTADNNVTPKDVWVRFSACQKLGQNQMLPGRMMGDE